MDRLTVPVKPMSEAELAAMSPLQVRWLLRHVQVKLEAMWNRIDRKQTQEAAGVIAKVTAVELMGRYVELERVESQLRRLLPLERKRAKRPEEVQTSAPSPLVRHFQGFWTRLRKQDNGWYFTISDLNGKAVHEGWSQGGIEDAWDEARQIIQERCDGHSPRP